MPRVACNQPQRHQGPYRFGRSPFEERNFIPPIWAHQIVSNMETSPPPMPSVYLDERNDDELVDTNEVPVTEASHDMVPLSPPSIEPSPNAVLVEDYLQKFDSKIQENREDRSSMIKYLRNAVGKGKNTAVASAKNTAVASPPDIVDSGYCNSPESSKTESSQGTTSPGTFNSPALQRYADVAAAMHNSGSATALRHFSKVTAALEDNRGSTSKMQASLGEDRRPFLGGSTSPIDVQRGAMSRSRSPIRSYEPSEQAYELYVTPAMESNLCMVPKAPEQRTDDKKEDFVDALRDRFASRKRDKAVLATSVLRTDLKTITSTLKIVKQAELPCYSDSRAPPKVFNKDRDLRNFGSQMEKLNSLSRAWTSAVEESSSPLSRSEVYAQCHGTPPRPGRMRAKR